MIIFIKNLTKLISFIIISTFTVNTSFATPTTQHTAVNQEPLIAPIWTINSLGFSQSGSIKPIGVVGDIDSDGKKEIAAEMIIPWGSSTEPRIVVLSGVNGQILSSAPIGSRHYLGPDINLDGVKEIIRVQMPVPGSGQIPQLIFVNGSSGNDIFSLPLNYPLNWIDDVLVEDLNSDGFAEVIVNMWGQDMIVPGNKAIINVYDGQYLQSAILLYPSLLAREVHNVDGGVFIGMKTFSDINNDGLREIYGAVAGGGATKRTFVHSGTNILWQIDPILHSTRVFDQYFYFLANDPNPANNNFFHLRKKIDGEETRSFEYPCGYFYQNNNFKPMHSSNSSLTLVAGHNNCTGQETLNLYSLNSLNSNPKWTVRADSNSLQFGTFLWIGDYINLPGLIAKDFITYSLDGNHFNLHRGEDGKMVSQITTAGSISDAKAIEDVTGDGEADLLMITNGPGSSVKLTLYGRN